MLILIVTAIVLVIGLLLLQINSDTCNILGVLIVICVVFTFVVGVIFLPINHMDTQNGIRQIEALQATLNNVRSNPETIENAALQLKIADANQWIASQQYWNNTAFDLWIPDAIDTIKPLR